MVVFWGHGYLVFQLPCTQLNSVLELQELFDFPDIIESSVELNSHHAEFINFANELGGDDDFLRNTKLLRKDFSSYMEMLVNHSRGIDLPNGWVPQTTFWYMHGVTQVIGMSSIRHRLTPALENIGGHIAYIIRPSERQKGHGNRLLSLTLEKAKVIGLKKVLLTTDIDNLASRKIIERNGGDLIENGNLSKYDDKKTRYWITLK